MSDPIGEIIEVQKKLAEDQILSALREFIDALQLTPKYLGLSIETTYLTHHPTGEKMFGIDSVTLEVQL
jgi:hypothetical protein